MKKASNPKPTFKKPPPPPELPKTTNGTWTPPCNEIPPQLPTRKPCTCDGYKAGR